MRVCVKLVKNTEYIYTQYKYMGQSMIISTIELPKGSIKKLTGKEPEENKEITILVK